MKSLTQTITFCALTLLLSPMAQAFVGGSPELNCRDTSIMIPEQKVVVQVFAKSEANPYVHVRVQKQDLNAPDITLFEGNVSQTDEVGAKTFNGYGLDMKLAETPEGQIAGVVNVETATNQVQTYKVNCQVFYQLMSAKKPAPPIEQL